MNSKDIDNLLTSSKYKISKWELDNIVYWDRTTNPDTLVKFFKRIKVLEYNQNKSTEENVELEYHLALLSELDFEQCQDLLNEKTDDDAKNRFLENLARTCAIETLTAGKLSFESMETACKLNPNDFILCAKRTQDLINAIHGFVIKGETLSRDVAGA